VKRSLIGLRKCLPVIGFASNVFFVDLSWIGMSREASSEMRLAILTDFDGTVTVNDTFESVLAEFAQSD
jgi:hypothetical protein